VLVVCFEMPRKSVLARVSSPDDRVGLLLPIPAQAKRDSAFSRDRKEPHVGADDKLENMKQDVSGKAKEALGKATDDEELQGKGKTDQAKSDLKQAGENVKDAFKH
jgi:uncharacterized protein YjbJ (UPF0337 family)